MWTAAGKIDFSPAAYSIRTFVGQFVETDIT